MSEPTSGLAAAVSRLHGKAPTITKDRTATVQLKAGGSYQYRYVSLDSIVEKIGPLLAEQELAWMTFPGRGVDGQLTLRYQLRHGPSGESVDGELPLLITGPGPQALGSAITYARRYALCAVLNIVADEDDDGASAQGAAEKPARAAQAPAKTVPEPRGKKGISQAQRARIQVLIKERAVTRLELANVLANWDIQVETGWMDRLTPGRDGTASALIDELEKFGTPLPDRESDVPADVEAFSPEVPA